MSYKGMLVKNESILRQTVYNFSFSKTSVAD